MMITTPLIKPNANQRKRKPNSLLSLFFFLIGALHIYNALQARKWLPATDRG